MAQLKTKILAVALVLGIAATGVTLAAGVTDTSGNGLVTVEQEPLQFGEVPADITFESSSPDQESRFEIFETAEGATVFEFEVTGIDGGNDFTVDQDVINTADHSLFLTIEVETPEDVHLFNADVENMGQQANSGNSMVEVEDGVFVTEIGPNQVDQSASGPNVIFDFGVANDAEANELYGIDINYEFEEVSPSQIDEMADRGN